MELLDFEISKQENPRSACPLGLGFMAAPLYPFHSTLDLCVRGVWSTFQVAFIASLFCVNLFGKGLGKSPRVIGSGLPSTTC